MNKELKPCPFCGSVDIVIIHDDGVFWHKCRDCGASGPVISKYSDETEPDWNTRPSPWVKVTPETMPKDPSPVLVAIAPLWIGANNTYATAQWQDGKWYHCGADAQVRDVVKWMPIPEGA